MLKLKEEKASPELEKKLSELEAQFKNSFATHVANYEKAVSAILDNLEAKIAEIEDKIPTATPVEVPEAPTSSAPSGPSSGRRGSARDGAPRPPNSPPPSPVR